MIPNKVYDILKWVALIVLPGLASYIGDVGPAWGMQNVDAVVLTLVKTGWLLGVLIGVSTISYNHKASKGA